MSDERPSADTQPTASIKELPAENWVMKDVRDDYVSEDVKKNFNVPENWDAIKDQRPFQSEQEMRNTILDAFGVPESVIPRSTPSPEKSGIDWTEVNETLKALDNTEVALALFDERIQAIEKKMEQMCDMLKALTTCHNQDMEQRVRMRQEIGNLTQTVTMNGNTLGDMGGSVSDLMDLFTKAGAERDQMKHDISESPSIEDMMELTSRIQTLEQQIKVTNNTFESIAKHSNAQNELIRQLLEDVITQKRYNAQYVLSGSDMRVRLDKLEKHEAAAKERLDIHEKRQMALEESIELLEARAGTEAKPKAKPRAPKKKS